MDHLNFNIYYDKGTKFLIYTNKGSYLATVKLEENVVDLQRAIYFTDDEDGKYIDSLAISRGFLKVYTRIDGTDTWYNGYEEKLKHIVNNIITKIRYIIRDKQLYLF